MGHCQYPEYACGQRFPIVKTDDLSDAQLRQLAGNATRLQNGSLESAGGWLGQAMHCAVMGALWAAIAVTLKMQR